MKNFRSYLKTLAFIFFFLSGLLFSQTFNVKGTITISGKPVVNASVTFTDIADSSKKFTALTDSLGKYSLGVITGVTNQSPVKGSNHIELYQNYPNPFSSSTSISYSLNNPSDVSICIYDILGRQVKSFNLSEVSKGLHSFIWDGTNNLNEKVRSGIYLLQLHSGSETQVRKMIFNTGINSISSPALLRTAFPTKICSPASVMSNEKKLNILHSVQFRVKVTNILSTYPKIEDITIKSVNVSSDTTMDFSAQEASSKAEAGDDQVSYVGSYALLDASNSILNGETIKYIDWLNAPDNPDELLILHSNRLTDKSVIEFGKEGTYKFILKIECKSGIVFTDSMKVTVKPRQMSVIEDTCLEINIRVQLKYKEGALTTDKIQLLDSLLVQYLYPGGKVTSLKGMEYCTNLISFELLLQSISDLHPISNLTKLEILSLSQVKTLTDISPLSNLTNLKRLNIYGNPIQDISALRNMTKLTYLDASYTQFSDLSPLSNLVNMEDLNLDGTVSGIAFKSLDPLRNMTKLRFLEVGGRGIEDITPLENLTELIYLELSFNNITNIAPAMKLKKLDRLIVGQNKISDLKGLRNLENLDYLDAAYNQIKDISELQYMTKVHLIGLAFNQIEDLLPIVNNPNIGEGVDLYVTQNPLSDKSLNEYIPALIQRGVAVYNWK